MLSLLGEVVQDIVTGEQGIVMGESRYLDGSQQVYVSSSKTDDRAVWIPRYRVFPVPHDFMGGEGLTKLRSSCSRIGTNLEAINQASKLEEHLAKVEDFVVKKEI